MLSPYEFETLSRAYLGPIGSQRALAEDAAMSLGSANKAFKSLRSKEFISERGEITAKGVLALEPYRARSVVILAAGMGTRMAPLSFERPKALFEGSGRGTH